MSAVVLYCSFDDVAAVGVGANFLRGIDETRQTAAITDASRLIDGSLKSRFILPLTRVGGDIKRCCAIIVAYDLASGQGYNPADAGDDNLRLRYKDQLDWLKQIAAGNVTPDVDDSSGSASGVASFKAKITSNTQRGWYVKDGTGGPFSGGR